MSLIKWSPFFEPFEPFEKFLDPSLATPRGGSLVPAVNVIDRKDSVVIEAALPGVQPGDVEVSVEGGLLTLKGQSERKTEVDEKDYYRKEIRTGSFMRQIPLPQGVDEAQASASFKDGILAISFPKLKDPGTKTIKIDVN